MIAGSTADRVKYVTSIVGALAHMFEVSEIQTFTREEVATILLKTAFELEEKYLGGKEGG